MQISHRLFDKSYVFIYSPADLRLVRSQAGLSVTNSENLEVSEVLLMKELPLLEVRPHNVWQRGLGKPLALCIYPIDYRTRLCCNNAMNRCESLFAPNQHTRPLDQSGGECCCRLTVDCGVD